MLTRTEMFVVFMLDEIISQGSLHDLRQGNSLSLFIKDMTGLSLKCHRDELVKETLRGGTR